MRWALAVAAAVVGLLSFAADRVEAAPPKGLDLLPPDTVLYLSVPNAQELIERFGESSLGQMLEDEQMRPLVQQIYGSLMGLTTAVDDELGVGVQQILNMPHGEITIAVVPPAQGTLAVVVLFDAGEQHEVMETLLERGVQQALRDGGRAERRELAGRTVDVVSNANESFRVFWTQQDGAFLLCSDESVMQSLLTVWDGGAETTLRDNQDFAAIMNRCRGAEDEEPQFRWFVDPINLVREATRGNNAVQLGLAVLPVLGLDGLLGVGGTVSLATEEFDSLIHAHLLLDQPRTGVLEMLALIPGETAPEPWVTDEAINYWTLTWDFETTFRELRELVDGFQGQGAFRNQLQRRVERVGLDFEQDILAQLHGRVSIFRWVEPPTRPESASVVVGFQLRDAEEATEIIDSVMRQFPDRFEQAEYNGVSYWVQIERPRPEDAPQRPLDPRPRLTLGVLGDYCLVTDRPGSFEKAVLTSTEPENSLAQSLEYKLIASRIRRELRGVRPGMVSFQRPEQGIRFLYDLANSPEVRERMRLAMGEASAFQAVDTALIENPLPPFSVLQQYLAPGGNLVTDDETGFHYMEFTLRRKR